MTDKEYADILQKLLSEARANYDRVAAERDDLITKLGEKPETKDSIAAMQTELGRVIGERDALARHIEALIAPVTQSEVDLAHAAFEKYDELCPVLQNFLAARLLAGQFKAFE